MLMIFVIVHIFSISISDDLRTLIFFGLDLFFNVVSIMGYRSLCACIHICNIARFLIKRYVITYLLYQHLSRVQSTGVPRSRVALRAIQVTILVFTMKFQTGGDSGSTRVLTRKREKIERERD